MRAAAAAGAGFINDVRAYGGPAPSKLPASWIYLSA